MAYRQYPISTDHLTWIEALCKRGDVDTARLFSDCGVTPAMRQSPDNCLPWSIYANLVSTVAKLFADDELRQAGSLSWQSRDLQIQRNIGRVLFNPTDLYLALYGPSGYCCIEYPMESRVRQLNDNSLSIELRMSNDARYCYPLFTFLAGQMEALPSGLGLTTASITMKPIDQGAIYSVHYPTPSRFGQTLQRAWQWSRASTPITRDFALLAEKHRRALLERRRSSLEGTEAAREHAIQEQNLRLVTENVSDAVWALNQQGNITWCSPSTCSLLGYSAEDLRNLPLDAILGQAAGEALMEAHEALLEAELSCTHDFEELLVNNRTGDSLWLSLRMIHHSHTSRAAVVCVARDISERKRAETELAARTTSHQAITDSALDAIITFDNDLHLTYANPSATRIFGYPAIDLMQMQVDQLMPASLNDERLRRLYHLGAVDTGSGISARGLRRDKSIVPLEVTFASHDNLRTCIVRDVTTRLIEERERRGLRAQLEASQKMDAVGQLSGGIAHDFNNLLVAILGYAELAQQSDNPDEHAAYLAEIRRAGETGADMTRKLLTFSRRQVIDTKLVEAFDLIKGVQPMIRRLLPSNISMRFTNEAGHVYLNADPVQLEQVLVNLAINARDAMPAGGSFRINLRQQERGTGVQPQLCISVSDNGTGMSEDIRARMFEPLYTTKPEGKGTGLGMAVVYSIISQHQGFIDVESTIGEGTTIRIYLPTSSSRPASEPVPEAMGAGANAETILVIEDNDQVRDLARLMLKGAGYRVLEAADGQAGVSMFEKHRGTIDLVLMDIVMPRKSGREAAGEIRQIEPGANIVFTSGYLDDSPHIRFIVDQQLPMIPKPYGTAQLRSRVRAALDQHRRAARPGQRQRT